MVFPVGFLNQWIDYLVVWDMKFIFHNIWDNPSQLTIFFFSKMVKTTNQISYWEHEFYDFP